MFRLGEINGIDFFRLDKHKRLVITEDGCMLYEFRSQADAGHIEHLLRDPAISFYEKACYQLVCSTALLNSLAIPLSRLVLAGGTSMPIATTILRFSPHCLDQLLVLFNAMVWDKDPSEDETVYYRRILLENSLKY